MSKSLKPLRALWLLGASIVLILLIGSLVKYELVADSILRWIDQLKARK